MRKSALGLLLALLIVFSLVLVTTWHFSGAQTSGTNVNGIIYSNTIWTQANSPYTFTGPVVINAGVTLTIQAGVTVDFGTSYLEVNGTLDAQGIETEPIHFNLQNGGGIGFNSMSTSWNKLTNSGCIIEYADIQSASGSCIQTYGASPMIANNIINASGGIQATAIIVYGGSSVISNNNITVEGNTVGAIGWWGGSGLPLISNNIIIFAGGILPECGIEYNGDANGGFGGAIISGNLISGWNCGITSGNNTIIGGNLVLNNNNGIMFEGYNLYNQVIQNNTITNNQYGVNINTLPSSSVLNNNDIYGNTQDNIYLGSTVNADATDNWWGTTNQQAINQTIYDYKDNFNLGNVTFVPFLTAPNTEAPTYINATAGANGSINPRGIISLSYGGSRTFTITPNTGYYIADVLVNGTSVVAVSSYTVQNVNGATTIEATFAPNPTSTPSPAVSPTPPPSAKPTASPTSSPTATPTVPEIPSVIIALAIILAASIATIYLHKKTPAPIIHESYPPC